MQMHINPAFLMTDEMTPFFFILTDTFPDLSEGSMKIREGLI
jgi:hypothetical protein